MVDVMELLRRRRSIRRYDERGIEKEVIDVLKEAVIRSPSSRGINPWRFVFTADKTLLQKLAHAKAHGSDFLAEAALGIVICADGAESDVWIEDCSIAAIIIQIAALEMGLGSCWVQIRNRSYSDTVTSEEYVRGIMGLPENIRIECIISLGHPAEDLPPVPSEDLDWQKIVQM